MRIRLFTVLLALLALAVACSSGDVASSATEADATAPRAVAAEDVDEADFEPPREAAAEADDAGGGAANLVTTGSTGGPPVAQLPDLGRDIIYTADLEIASTDVTIATREAIRTVEGFGGFLFSQQTSGGSGGSSRLVFKILPTQFQNALNELGSIGAVRSQSISADDVTGIVVDLQSRITTAEASVVRLRGFLDGAESIDVIASLESELLQRETTLEQLRGQLRSVQNQVDLATINLTVTELLNRPDLELTVVTYADHDAGFNCPDAHRIGRVAEGAAVTICYRLTNAGDTDLVDLAIDDPILGAGLDDLIVVEGSTAELAPGESLLVAHEIDLDESLRLRTTASARALDVDGDPIDGDVVATGPRVRIDVEDSGLPGFGDVLDASLSALVTVGMLVALGLIAAAPFAVVVAILGGVGWFLIRPILRRTRRRVTHRWDSESPHEGDARDDDEQVTVSS